MFKIKLRKIVRTTAFNHLLQLELSTGIHIQPFVGLEIRVIPGDPESEEKVDAVIVTPFYVETEVWAVPEAVYMGPDEFQAHIDKYLAKGWEVSK
jgi:hypothetical protein